MAASSAQSKRPPALRDATALLMRHRPAFAEPLPRADVLHYITQMTAELSSLARSARLDILAYFLDMARVEAAATAVDEAVADDQDDSAT